MSDKCAIFKAVSILYYLKKYILTTLTRSINISITEKEQGKKNIKLEVRGKKPYKRSEIFTDLDTFITHNKDYTDIDIDIDLTVCKIPLLAWKKRKIQKVVMF